MNKSKERIKKLITFYKSLSKQVDEREVELLDVLEIYNIKDAKTLYKILEKA